MAACESWLRYMGGGAVHASFAPVDALLGRLVHLSSKEGDIGAMETCYRNLACSLVECAEHVRSVS